LADKNDANIVDEVEKRLDDLFGDMAETSDFEEDKEAVEPSPSFKEGRSDIEDSPLKELKSTVLSIDWEITDEIMTKFLDQVEALKTRYEDDKVIQMFLQLLGSVGKYIKAKKANADPDVVKLLNTAYDGLEKVLLTEGITEAEKKKLVVTQVNKFKKLKERLAVKAPADKRGAVSPPAEKKEIKKPPVQKKEVKEAAAKKRPLAERREKIVEPRKEVRRPAAEAEEVKTPVTATGPAISARKGMGIGNRMVLTVLLPLLIVAALGYAYVIRFAGFAAQVDQIVQAFSGVSAEGARNIVLTILWGLVILIGLIAALYGKKLAGRIRSLTDVVERIAAGRKDTSIEIKASGEIGALTEAIRRMRDNLR